MATASAHLWVGGKYKATVLQTQGETYLVLPTFRFVAVNRGWHELINHPIMQASSSQFVSLTLKSGCGLAG